MVTEDQYCTGTSWEYLYQDGSPGIGLFTSLGHPWGGSPTYIYTGYILGLRTEWNEVNKSYQWIADPAFDVAAGLGITWASGKVPLPSGGHIQMCWSKGGSGCLGKKRGLLKTIGEYTVYVDVVGSDVKVDIKQQG